MKNKSQRNVLCDKFMNKTPRETFRRSAISWTHSRFSFHFIFSDRMLAHVSRSLQNGIASTQYWRLIELRRQMTCVPFIRARAHFIFFCSNLINWHPSPNAIFFLLSIALVAFFWIIIIICVLLLCVAIHTSIAVFSERGGQRPSHYSSNLLFWN